ncbi:glycosyltransferase [Sphingomonas sp. Ant20]|uniref:glycosyltransferase n=1 Tax=Sphingomonas sp. Ant20 TaxID=104605 RepID=UPI000B0FC6B1|nr:glycosyltransferase [Sphingomonas sp. Ant20]
MRILHILDHGLPLQSGYTFRTRAILKAQEARGWTVAAVTGQRHGSAAAAVESVDGLTFHRTPATRRSGPLGEIAGIRAFARRIEAAVDAFRPDILHAHSPVLDALAGLIVARRRKLPLVYEIRASGRMPRSVTAPGPRDRSPIGRRARSRPGRSAVRTASR